MKNRIVFCSFVGLCSLARVAAQDSVHLQQPLFVQASFYYDVPLSFGAKAGFEFPFRNKTKIISKKNGQQKIKSVDYLFACNGGFYRYAFNSTGISLVPSVGIRHNIGRIFYSEWFIGMGLLRTFYDGKVYEVSSSGAIAEIPLFGRFYAISSFSAVAGWDFEKAKKQFPLAVQVKPGLWL